MKSALKVEAGERWAESLVRRAGLAMKKARGNKSAKWLSDETAALGHRVSPTVVAKLDSGHRGSVLSVAELLTLAAALNIPPGLLLFPGYPTGEVEFLPGRTTDAKAAVDWFSGESRLPAEPGPEGEPRGMVPNAGIELVRLVHEYRDATMRSVGLQVTRGLMTDPATRGLKTQTAADRRLVDQQVRDLHERLGELQAQIDELGATFEVEEKPR